MGKRKGYPPRAEIEQIFGLDGTSVLNAAECFERVYSDLRLVPSDGYEQLKREYEKRGRRTSRYTATPDVQTIELRRGQTKVLRQS